MSLAISSHEELRDYAVEIRIRNARILGLMRRVGIASLSELARRARCAPTGVGRLVNLKVTPLGATGDYRPEVHRIADALFCHPDDMFTDRQRYSFMASNRRCIEMSEAEVETQLAALQVQAPEEHIAQIERHDAVNKALATLTPRQERVVRLRFGLGDEGAHTLDQVAEAINVTRERVHQIEATALRKLGTKQRGLHLIAGVPPKGSEAAQKLAEAERGRQAAQQSLDAYWQRWEAAKRGTDLKIIAREALSHLMQRRNPTEPGQATLGQWCTNNIFPAGAVNAANIAEAMDTLLAEIPADARLSACALGIPAFWRGANATNAFASVRVIESDQTMRLDVTWDGARP